MKIRTLKYHIQQGTKSLLKNRLMSLASIATVAANSFILIVSLCIVLNLDYMLEQVENNVGISVFVSSGATDDEVSLIEQEIKKIPHIKNVQYISEQDALEWAQESWGDENDILTGLEKDNPFPRSFDIALDDIKFQKDVIKFLEQLQTDMEIKLLSQRGILKNDSQAETSETSESDTTAPSDKLISKEDIKNPDYSFIGIEKIRHAQREAEILLTISTAFRIISAILILIMGVIAVVIIMNTIKLTVFIRKNEINIMKYIGATDWFIRWPFIVEGILIGLIGALIPCIICSAAYTQSIEIINEKMSFLANIAQFRPWLDLFSFIIPSALILGMTLGVLGSITSIRKHLNV